MPKIACVNCGRPVVPGKLNHQGKCSTCRRKTALVTPAEPDEPEPAPDPETPEP